MHVLRRRGWALKENLVTPEAVALNRRAFIAGGAALMSLPAMAAENADALHPYPANASFSAGPGRAITPEADSSSYNNFYEFGTSKYIQKKAQALPVRPWMLTIDGMVEKKIEIGIDDLIKAMQPREERIYRFRCVEAWSMVVPWSGFPLRALLDFAKPLGSARFVRFETFMMPSVAPEQAIPLYPWPYVEGLTMAEAAHDLAFMVTGVYGKALPKQFGAPLRLAVPWKYGFKSIKSIRRISFVAERPVGMWEALQPKEYGFFANVNPKVSHPRWSQADEKVLGESQRIPTQLFNGYADEVGGLYAGLEKETLWR
ncbi:MAG: protein-methionine-sulfoxide reductase catalytic subunit MsrP [Proteobacteria bacterium]|nr:protein-methionine-sulfoxide reductase catalytic subunit MsrP [Pseudomonadota bacterium]